LRITQSIDAVDRAVQPGVARAPRFHRALVVLGNRNWLAGLV